MRSLVIATARNERELQEPLSLGADVVIPFTLDGQHPSDAKDIATQTMLLSEIEATWKAPAKPRVVVTFHQYAGS